jgi:hypothetical protein
VIQRASVDRLKKGWTAPAWVFASVSGTRLDPSNVRKAFDRVLAAAEVHHRGLHQMRHTCASSLLQRGAAITYVARQLGHRDASTTLRIYAHWLPDASRTRAVDLLDGTQPAATPAQPAAVDAEWKNALKAAGSVVSRVGIEFGVVRHGTCVIERSDRFRLSNMLKIARRQAGVVIAITFSRLVPSAVAQ